MTTTYTSQSTAKSSPISFVGAPIAFKTMNMSAKAALGTLALATLTAVEVILFVHMKIPKSSVTFTI